MMIAYNKGDLFDAMITALLSEEKIINLFTKKLDLEEFDNEPINELLDNILTRFKHIRGCWFINKLKGQKKQNSSHSTRKHVQVKTEIAAATADARSEAVLKKYYGDATNNIRNSNDEFD
mmetsp:Transcript_24989/g.27968  ORF Transcript_24989/g.27968 Transcript_24989/m.27968 type:complete len:120 (-) Transcript_24989:29-388(-)